MPCPITLTTILPGGMGPLVFQEIGWDEEDPLDLTQGKDKASFSKLGSSLCGGKGGDQGTVAVWFGKALEQAHSQH